MTKNWDSINQPFEKIELARILLPNLPRKAICCACSKVFDYVPMAAGEKLKYVSVDSDGQSRDISRALALLEKA